MGCGDHQVHWINPGQENVAISGHTGPVNSIQEIDEFTIVTGSWDGSFQIIDLPSRSVKKKVAGFSYATTLLVHSSMSNFLISYRRVPRQSS